MNSQMQAYLSIMILSHLIATVVAGSNWKYFIWSILSFWIGILLWDGLTKKLIRASRKSSFREKFRLAGASIHSLSIEEARVHAERVLANSQRFHVVTSSPRKNKQVPGLAQTLETFFSTWSAIRSVRGEFELNEAFMREASPVPGAVRIGRDMDFVDYLVKSNQNEVIEIGSGDDWESAVKYPSVYHLVLVTDWTLKQADDEEVNPS